MSVTNIGKRTMEKPLIENPRSKPSLQGISSTALSLERKDSPKRRVSNQFSKVLRI